MMTASRAPVGIHGSILIVDDDEDVRAPMVEYLELALPDVKVRAVADAESAIDIMDHDGVDIVISDHRLPGRTGLDLLAHLKAHHPDTRRILFTGDPEPGLARSASGSAGTDLIFMKPIGLPFLLRAVEGILRRENDR